MPKTKYTSEEVIDETVEPFGSLAFEPSSDDERQGCYSLLIDPSPHFYGRLRYRPKPGSVMLTVHDWNDRKHVFRASKGGNLWHQRGKGAAPVLVGRILDGGLLWFTLPGRSNVRSVVANYDYRLHEE
jgi:hypothetical protein